MKIKFYGVRGSIPVCGREYERYGGNTTCISILREQVNRIAILDAGTGIRILGNELVAKKLSQSVINIMFTHFHWDHIQGFPFFAPAYIRNQHIGLLTMGKKRKIKNLKEIFSMQMQKEFFPVQLDKMGANFEFFHYGIKETIYGAKLKAVAQYHKFRGGSFGFRLDDDDVSLVVCTDVEHYRGIDKKIVELAMGADVLVHDGQYTPDEYKTHKGWGHSSWTQAVEVAKRAGVKKLIITHHDPDHDDDFLDVVEENCKKAFPNCELAKEGMEVKVG
ncbi:MAG: MBL fold metallo-hydrolase [Bacteroidetes bacterium]|nr:MBL fold metallo-hydrolase [Bacteroidota bacterium]